MKFAKLALCCLLVVWLCYLSLRVRQANELALQACSFAHAVLKNDRDAGGRLKWSDDDCPWPGDRFSTPIGVAPKLP